MTATTTPPGDLMVDHRVPDRSRADRPRSFEVCDFPVPTGREEDWRFTPLDRIVALLADRPDGQPLDLTSTLPEGVGLAEVSTEQARALGAPAPQDRAAVVAVANAGSALHLDIPAGAEPVDPVWLGLNGSGQTAFGHLVVTAGRGSRATVVVEHTGSAAFSEVLSVITADDVRLTVISLQQWQDDARHLGQHDVVVGRDARVRHIAVSLGGSVVRLNANATFAGPGGDFEALGLYFADAGQHLESRLFVDHTAPHCRSNVLYKGALQGESAHTVWVGDVLIRAEAEGTDTYELNRNLLLTDGARADSVPNLEIETGEIVGAGHASATGRFDDEQLFYLCSRGIPEDEARRLVVRAFFVDLLQRIEVREVVDRLTTAIEDELSASMGAGGGGSR